MRLNMKRVPIRLGIFLLVAFAGALSLVWYAGPTHRITREMQQQIQEGMTLAEVEAILGCPPGCYFAGRAAVRIGAENSDFEREIWLFCENEREVEQRVVHNLDADYQYTWVTCTGAVAVDCNAERRVIYSSFCEVEPTGLFERFRLWLSNQF